MWQEAEQAGVVHMCGFNYRFVPAVRLVRELLDATPIEGIRPTGGPDGPRAIRPAGQGAASA